MFKKKPILFLIISFLLFLLISGCSKNVLKQDCSNIDYDYITKISNSGSMLPALNETMDLYFKIPSSEKDINVGDIIDFKTNDVWNPYTGATDRVHRVIIIDRDIEGWYAITKGDASQNQDVGKRRFSDIKGVLICY